MDVLEGYKERRAQIGKTALENCCEEQMAVQDCYENGSLGEKLVLCRGPKKRFERCYDMQSVCYLCGGGKEGAVWLTCLLEVFEGAGVLIEL